MLLAASSRFPAVADAVALGSAIPIPTAPVDTDTDTAVPATVVVCAGNLLSLSITAGVPDFGGKGGLEALALSAKETVAVAGGVFEIVLAPAPVLVPPVTTFRESVAGDVAVTFTGVCVCACVEVGVCDLPGLCLDADDRLRRGEVEGDIAGEPVGESANASESVLLLAFSTFADLVADECLSCFCCAAVPLPLLLVLVK